MIRDEQLTQVAVVLLVLPFQVALLSRVWDAAWGVKVTSPIGLLVHNLLSSAQLIAMAILALAPSPGFFAVGTVYLVMAGGVLVLRSRSTQRDCGCFGSAIPTSLGLSLAAFDLCLGVIATAAGWADRLTDSAVGARYGLIGGAMLAVFVAVVLIPSRALLAAARDLASPHYRTVRGFMDVPKATPS